MSTDTIIQIVAAVMFVVCVGIIIARRKRMASRR
jgi:hypothetical protein